MRGDSGKDSLDHNNVRWTNAVNMARQLVMADEHGNDLVYQYLKLLVNGLEQAKSGQTNEVLVVGAGIAGMVAADLLAGVGHTVTIIEANDDRVGGRVKTIRDLDGKDQPFEDKEQYAEAGAMRFPNFHPLLFALIDSLKIPRQQFYYVDVEPDSIPDKVTYTAAPGEMGFQEPATPQPTPEDGAPVGRIAYVAQDGAGVFATGVNEVTQAKASNRTWYLTNGTKQRKSTDERVPPEEREAGYAQSPADTNNGFTEDSTAAA